MKRIAALMVALAVGITANAQAQHVIGAGVYGDYYKHNATDQNFGGVGARLAIAMSPNVTLEADVAYDVSQVFTEGFSDPTTGVVTVRQSDVRVIHGMAGPVFHSNGPVQFFVTLKGGFNHFRFDPRPPALDTFTSTVEDLRARDVSGIVYPGAGLQAAIGPFALRMDIGDEIYFSDGAQHNLRIAIGPTITF